jgi:CheY-like chemotaxis protein
VLRVISAFGILDNKMATDLTDKTVAPTAAAEVQTDKHQGTDRPTPEPSNYSPPKPLVLLAEDEAIIREHMALLLRELGYRVVKAADGEEALCIFKGIPGMMIDLLLTDIVMPKMGGKELAYKIASLSPGTKVMFCSAYPEQLAARNGMIDTRIPFLQKPVTADSLAAKLREVLTEPENEPPAEWPVDD